MEVNDLKVGMKVRPLGGGIVEPTGKVIAIIERKNFPRVPYVLVKYPDDDMPIAYFPQDLMGGEK